MGPFQSPLCMVNIRTEHQNLRVQASAEVNRQFFSPRGSQCLNDEHLAQIVLIISYIEIQSPHYLVTWAPRV